MLFLTYWFVLFIAALYPVYWFVPYRRVRLAVLLAGCCVFHTHFAGPAGVLPIIALAALTYLAGLTRNRWACGLAVVASALALVYYKYTKFLCAAVVGAVWPRASAYLLETGKAWVSPVPPLAISFFAFEFIHYLVDVARGGPPIRKPRDFALYAVFWPSIVAGPVKRYRQFLGALNHAVRSVESRDVAVGLTRVAAGLVKKFAADTLTAWINNRGRALVVRLATMTARSVAPAVEPLLAAGFTELLVHGVSRPQRATEIETLFVFASPNEAVSKAGLDGIELMLPHLHSTYLRVQSIEREIAEAGVRPHAPGVGYSSASISEREEQVLGWVREGMSNQEIGVQLGISPLTVKNHVQKILRKLGATNRAQAVARAMSMNLLVNATEVNGSRK